LEVVPPILLGLYYEGLEDAVPRDGGGQLLQVILVNVVPYPLCDVYLFYA